MAGSCSYKLYGDKLNKILLDYSLSNSSLHVSLTCEGATSYLVLGEGGALHEVRAVLVLFDADFRKFLGLETLDLQEQEFKKLSITGIYLLYLFTNLTRET